MREPFQIFDIDRKAYSAKMADNLPVLRAKLGLSQEGLAGIIGITRQTISSIENKSRECLGLHSCRCYFCFKEFRYADANEGNGNL